MDSALPKQYLPLIGRPVIAHTLDTLLRHPRLGPAIVHWQRHRAIAPRAKRLALVSMAASFSLSLALLPSVAWVYVIVVTIWALLSLWMWRLPEMPEPVGIKVEPASSSGV